MVLVLIDCSIHEPGEFPNLINNTTVASTREKCDTNTHALSHYSLCSQVMPQRPQSVYKLGSQRMVQYQQLLPKCSLIRAERNLSIDLLCPFYTMLPVKNTLHYDTQEKSHSN